MKRSLGAVGLLLVALSGLGVGYLLRSQSGATTYTVVRGDTLGEIATLYGVSVDDLRTWNGIEGDLIEVGDVLTIYGDAPDVVAPRPSSKRTARPRPRPESGGTAALVMPAPKPCLAAPTLDGTAEEAMVASAGLAYPQIKAAMDAFVPTTLRCVPEGTSGRMETRIVVGCDGRVRRVELASAGGLPAEVTDCVVDTLRYAEFPAHDLPDGEVFDYPLSFSWE